jgi:hypothetical protein
MKHEREYTPQDFALIDDGTLDTCIRLPNGEVWRYDDSSDYRDDEGILDFDRYITEVVLPYIERLS